MAKKMILIDDIDGTEAEETLKFGLDGAQYQIDLNTANAAALRHVLDPYIKSGKRVGGTRRRNRGTAAPQGEAAIIRAWARDHGHDVPARGRIPSAVREAYEAAH